MARRRARELAFRTLFQSERGGVPLAEVWEAVRADLALSEPDPDADSTYGDPLDAEGVAFADRLLKAFAKHREEIDRRLDETIEGWSFPQMSQTDLNVLRLALTEFLYEEVPKEVTIEMAVRTAKRFGGEESGRFVNGVLADLYRSLRAAPQP